ncbi:MAG: hypothetical protein AOA66_0587 [Candidatus Bathyarchaeota archaeon BA2]|nr:MAG: hypothetical protein AOA66_0587 [Candidatus Bathyarchaeota archaeon BA2]
MNEVAYTLVGTLFGFFLLFAYDRWKERQEVLRQRRKILALLFDEINRNVYTSKKNLEILSNELKIIEETRTESVIQPVSFSTSSWLIARAGDITRFLDHSTMEKLSQLYQALEWVNSIIQNRELTRAASKQLIEYPIIIKAYNERLLKMMTELRPEIEDTVGIIKGLQKC